MGKKTTKLHLKKGDTVMVIAGADKGETGEILVVYPDKQKAIVKGLKMVTKHRKPTTEQPGSIEKMEAPIHISNLMVIVKGEASRLGRKLVDGKLKRYSKKTGEIIA